MKNGFNCKIELYLVEKRSLTLQTFLTKGTDW